MRTDFCDIEISMKELVAEMDQISVISTNLTKVMKPQRDEISELVSQNETLTKIQFLFELPKELNKKIDGGELNAAVEDYQKANRSRSPTLIL
jgi:gas vesicle protein